MWPSCPSTIRCSSPWHHSYPQRICFLLVQPQRQCRYLLSDTNDVFGRVRYQAHPQSLITDENSLLPSSNKNDRAVSTLDAHTIQNTILELNVTASQVLSHPPFHIAWFRSHFRFASSGRWSDCHRRSRSGGGSAGHGDSTLGYSCKPTKES